MKYDSISHLVRSVRVEPDFIDIEFCSDCGELEQMVSVPRQKQAGSSRRSGVSLGGWVRSRVRRLLGHEENLESLSHEEKAALTCQGFQQLRPRLRLVNGRWVRAHKDQHPSEYFDQQLRSNPIVHDYDIEVLVRVLLEVSRSDSELRKEEKAFLAEIVSDEATIERLSKAPHITVAELAETSSVPVKETILMLAWAMAYADGRLDYEEMSHLSQLCRGFMLPEKRVRELQMASKLFLLDRHFQNLKESMSGRELKESFETKAQDWGLDDQQLQTLRSWYPE
ncbi:MAG: TerB family tellurite resistance protein, partial [Candidatus Eremiobacteraeota bacterium]|nr:TerB family tellurite resistance protein [Candidatus Eremiobacteraeota bacterium]